MKCPFCSNRLRQVKSRSAIIDICPKCKGIWFDSGELADFIRTLTESGKIPPKKPPVFERRKVQTSYSVKEEDRICPKCEKGLRRFNYSYDSNVFLDKCPDCGGIWTDGGEVQQIVRYLTQDTRIAPSARVAKQVVKSPKPNKETASRGRDIKISEDIEQDLRVKAIRRDLVRSKEHMQLLKDLGEIGDFASTRIIPGASLMLPLSDENPRERFPGVTISIILLCTAIFLGQVFWVQNLGAFFSKFGLVPQHFFSIGLVSSMFLHGGFFHLLVNMYFLWLFGDNVEDRFGHLWYIVFYLCCGLAASVLHTILNLHSPIPCIGASGAIAGVMGAYYIFYPRARIRLFVGYRVLHVHAFVYLVFWLLLQLASSLISVVGGPTRIAWFAHIGGFVFGVGVAYFKKRAVQAKE